MRIHPALVCPLLAAAFGPLPLQAYENPPTIPVPLRYPNAFGSTKEGYFDLPSSYDVSTVFKEFTSPGPVANLYFNVPADSGIGSRVRIQLWFLDPEPEAPSDTDGNRTSETTDERYIGQVLDLDDMLGVLSIITNFTKQEGANAPGFEGSLAWLVSYAINDDSTGYDYTKPVALNVGSYALNDNDLVSYNSSSWNTPYYSNVDYTEGCVSLYKPSTSYDLFFHLADNTDYVYSGWMATIGKVFDEDLPVLKSIVNADGSKLTSVSSLSSTFQAIPLWKSYTEEEFDQYLMPERDDFVRVTSVAIEDKAATAPANGLKFIEEPPYPSEDEDAEEGDMVDPNATIKNYFDVSISEEGLISYTLLESKTLSDSLANYYTFSFRVYVDDGVNDGVSGDYLKYQYYFYLYRPLVIYLGIADTAYSSTINYAIDDGDDDDSNDPPADNWKWFKSTSFGWYMEQNFPENRWIFSQEHGWIYATGESSYNDEGIIWYMAPSSYMGTEEVGDEVGWVWTDYSFYNGYNGDGRSYSGSFLYSYKDEGWLVYLKDFNLPKYDKDKDGNNTLSERVFWSYRQKKYITPDKVGAGLSQ